MKRLSFLLSLTACFLLMSEVVSAQCSMCRAVLETDQDGSMASGVNNGILYLMLVPYILVATIGFVIYKNKQKNQQI